METNTILHSFSQFRLWAYLLGDAIKRSLSVNVIQTAILKWALQFLRTPSSQSHSNCLCSKNIHWEGHFLFWTLCSPSDTLIDLYLNVALDSQVLISYHKTEKIRSSRWSNWPDPQRWMMSEANSGRELSPGLLLPTNLILKSNLPLFLEHPDFRPFPAFQDLHGTRLCQLAKSCLDQQDSAWSENSGAQWWRKRLQTNFEVILEGLKGFGSPLTLLKGDCLFCTTLKEEGRVPSEQFGDIEWNVIPHRAGERGLCFHIEHIKLTTISHVALEVKANPFWGVVTPA